MSLTRRLILTFIAACPFGEYLIAPRAVAQEAQYYRLQLKQGGKYLDAAYCSDKVALKGGSGYANGACQLWRFIPVSRRQGR